MRVQQRSRHGQCIVPDDLEKFYPKDENGKRDIHMDYTAEITKAYILE